MEYFDLSVFHILRFVFWAVGHCMPCLWLLLSVSLWFFEAQTPELCTGLRRALGFVQVAEAASLWGTFAAF